MENKPIGETKELAEHPKETAKDKFDELKNMSSEERMELAKAKASEAKEMANKAKEAAKEKFDELKNMTSEERMLLAKAKAGSAKSLARHAKDACVEKFHELKELPFSVLLERTKVYFIQMPLKIKIITIAAAVLAVPVTKAVVFPSYTPETIGENVCEALKDGDFEEAAKYLPPDQQKQGLAIMKNNMGNPQWLEKAKQRDCDIVQVGNWTTISKIVSFEYAPNIAVKLIDGNWYLATTIHRPIPSQPRK